MSRFPLGLETWSQDLGLGVSRPTVKDQVLGIETQVSQSLSWSQDVSLTFDNKTGTTFFYTGPKGRQNHRHAGRKWAVFLSGTTRATKNAALINKCTRCTKQLNFQHVATNITISGSVLAYWVHVSTDCISKYEQYCQYSAIKSSMLANNENIWKKGCHTTRSKDVRKYTEQTTSSYAF